MKSLDETRSKLAKGPLMIGTREAMGLLLVPRLPFPLVFLLLGGAGGAPPVEPRLFLFLTLS